MRRRRRGGAQCAFALQEQGRSSGQLSDQYTERGCSPTVRIVITQIFSLPGRRFFVAERRLSLGRRFNAGAVWEKSPVAERRLKDAKKRRFNVTTNSQQSQPSLRDWIIIRPSTGVETPA